MPPNKRVYGLTAAAIEAAHDEGIAFTWPGIEPVQQSSCRDLNLLHSAESQPFQECFGVELYPTLEAKAAYVFFHLTTSHVFANGNKRTAVLCLDAFLAANAHYLTLDNDEMYHLAKRVASSGEEGRAFPETFHELRRTLKANMLPFSAVRHVSETHYRNLHQQKWVIRRWPLNQPGAGLRQRDPQAASCHLQKV